MTALPTDHLAVIARLRAEISRVLGTLVTPHLAAPYALLDFPNHTNVGDSAIYGGELAWLRRTYRAPPAYMNQAKLPPVLDGMSGQSLILLHGGGNFGDIYPLHQHHREAILRHYPGRKVIQLPQSIHYQDVARADDTARAIEANGQFTLLTRDNESFEFVRRHFACEVEMCPDLAFALGPQLRPVPASRDVLLLLRQDKESVNPTMQVTLPSGWAVEDWIKEPADTRSRAARQARLQTLLSLDPRSLTKTARTRAYFNAIAQIRIERGLRQLSTARYVITDRLHGHILCTLLGIPHAFLDNSYGKIARFSSAYGTVWNGVTQAETLAHAIGSAEDWLARPSAPLRSPVVPQLTH